MNVKTAHEKAQIALTNFGNNPSEQIKSILNTIDKESEKGNFFVIIKAELTTLEANYLIYNLYFKIEQIDSHKNLIQISW